jgi:hypothetical protein
MAGAFVRVERRAASPMIPPTPFAEGRTAALLAAGATGAFGLFASVFLLPRYFQGVRDVSATHSGLLIYPLLLGLLASVNLTGALLTLPPAATRFATSPWARPPSPLRRDRCRIQVTLNARQVLFEHSRAWPRRPPPAAPGRSRAGSLITRRARSARASAGRTASPGIAAASRSPRTCERRRRR